MVDTFSLTCPTCGGKLEIQKDITRFACGYCGNEHLVNFGGGKVHLMPVVEKIEQVRVGVDKTASELAIRRLEKEIEELNTLLQDIGRFKSSLINDLSSGSKRGSILRQGLRQKMENESSSSKVSGLRAFFNTQFTLQELYERFQSLTPEEIKHLIQICKTRKTAISKSIIQEIIDDLNAIIPEDKAKQTLDDKLKQLQKHRQIVSQE